MNIKRDYAKLAESNTDIKAALDKFERGEIGHNRLYQITNRALGLCTMCCEKRTTSSLCERHKMARNRGHHRRVKARLRRDPEFKAKRKALKKQSARRTEQRKREALPGGYVPGEHRCSTCKERGHNAAGHWKHETKKQGDEK